MEIFSKLPFGGHLLVDYHAPCSVPATLGPRDGIWDHLDGSQDFDEQRDEEPDHSETGDVIMEGEVQEVPRSSRFTHELMTFLTIFPPSLILEDFD
jgi:hypothetical protein